MAEEYKDQAVNVQEEGVGEVKDRGLFDHFKGRVQEAPEDEQQQHHAANVPELGVGEVKDRGLFDHFKGKNESTEEKQKHQEDPQEVLVTGVGKIHIDEGYKEEEKEEMEEEKKHGFLDKLHRSGSSSSSSSSEEDESKIGAGNKEKTRTKKKSLKEKVHEKFHGGEKEPAFVPPVAAPATEDSSVYVEKVDVHGTPAATDEEKKGFLDKIKDKLPGHGKKPAEESGFVSPAPYPAAPAAVTEGVAVEHGKEQEVEGHEGKEKKGFLGKIMEKLPGYHKNTGEEGEKSPASH